MFKFKRNTKFKITKFHNPSSSIIRVIFYIDFQKSKYCHENYITHSQNNSTS